MRYIKLLMTSLTVLVSFGGVVQAAPEVNLTEEAEAYFVKAYQPFDSIDDYANWQVVSGYINEQNYEGARTTLETLIKKYPENLALQLKLGDTFLWLKNPPKAFHFYSQAKRQIQNQIKNKKSHSHFQFAQARVGEFRALQLMGKHKEAQSALKQNTLSAQHLSSQELDQLLGDISNGFHAVGQHARAFDYMKQAEKYLPQQSKLNEYWTSYQDQIIDQKYRIALGYYRLEDYGAALSVLEELVHIAPGEVKYSRLRELTHKRFLAEVKSRYKRLSPTLLRSFRQMRDHLSLDDYSQLHQNYQALMRDRDMAFFAEKTHRHYLPSKVLNSLRLIENSLIEYGYKV